MFYTYLEENSNSHFGRAISQLYSQGPTTSPELQSKGSKHMVTKVAARTTVVHSVILF